MKAIISLFGENEKAKTAVTRLKEAGFSSDKLSLITSYQAEEIRDMLDEEPEKTAATGALVGSGIGGTLGLLGSIALLPVPGVGPLLASGLMTTISGGVLGGYLGSIYATRLEDQPEIELKEALGEGEIILLVQIDDATEEKARTILQQSGGSYLETHDIDPKAIV